MQLTEQQEKNIRDLPCEMQLHVMHICAQELGLMDFKEAGEVLGVARRTIYDRIEADKLRTFTVGMHNFPLIYFE